VAALSPPISPTHTIINYTDRLINIYIEYVFVSGDTRRQETPGAAFVRS